MAARIKPSIERVKDDQQGIAEIEQSQFMQSIESIDPRQLPDDLKEVVDFDKLKQVFRDAKSIRLLLTGKTGSGKSTLVNGILGFNVNISEQEESAVAEHEIAKQGHPIAVGCTTKVNEYKKKKGSVNITVWDSPGLQDGTSKQDEYIAQMKAKCGSRDLTIYCLGISERRFVCSDDNPDVRAMKQLTNAFGPEFWNSTIIALTFANTLEAFNLEWQLLAPEERAKAFNSKISEWETQIRKILLEEVKLDEEVVKSVQVVPVGHYLKRHLLSIPYWLSNFWYKCFSEISTPEARAVLLKINAKRFKPALLAKSADFKRKPEDQPIVFNDKMISRLFGGLSISTSAFLCGLVGAGLGFAGILGGPIGVAITVPVGFVIGAVYGGVAGAIASRKRF